MPHARPRCLVCQSVNLHCRTEKMFHEYVIHCLDCGAIIFGSELGHARAARVADLRNAPVRKALDG